MQKPRAERPQGEGSVGQVKAFNFQDLLAALDYKERVGQRMRMGDNRDTAEQKVREAPKEKVVPEAAIPPVLPPPEMKAPVQKAVPAPSYASMAAKPGPQAHPMQPPSKPEKRER
jgi:hypothetical protein